MDSQDFDEFDKQNTNNIDNNMPSDTQSNQQGLNPSQLHAQNTMLHPNPFLQSDQLSSQFTPFNLQFPRNYAFNPMGAPFSNPLQQQYIPGFSFMPNADQTSNQSKQRKKKSKNPKVSQTIQSPPPRRWSSEEDIALTKAWLCISVDADVGTNQKSGSLWNRILQVWRNNMGEYDPTRNSNALSCHWGTIQSAVNKFHGFYEQLDRNPPPSGTNPDDMMREALRMYSDLNEVQFKFEHCWEIMKNNPKWCTQQFTKQNSSKKQKSVDNINVDNSTVEEPTYPTNPTIESTNSDGVPRPDGRKATKEKKRKAIAEKGVIDVLGNLQSTLEKQFEFKKEQLELKKERDRKEYELREKSMKEELELKKRNQKLKEKAQKRKDQERILNKDLSSMQPALRQSFEAIQAKILKEWENDALCEDGSEPIDVCD